MFSLAMDVALLNTCVSSMLPAVKLPIKKCIYWVWSNVSYSQTDLVCGEGLQGAHPKMVSLGTKAQDVIDIHNTSNSDDAVTQQRLGAFLDKERLEANGN